MRLTLTAAVRVGFSKRGQGGKNMERHQGGDQSAQSHAERCCFQTILFTFHSSTAQNHLDFITSEASIDGVGHKVQLPL